VCLISVPTLALAALDIKHLFDAPQKNVGPERYNGIARAFDRTIV